MQMHYKKTIKKNLRFLLIVNTLLFLVLAYFHLLSTDPKAAVFIDFLLRFTVYSMWFIGFTIYLKYVAHTKLLRTVILTAVCMNINIPFFF